MPLSFSPTSPFVRKVLVVAHECGLVWYVDFALRPAMIATEFKNG